MAAAVPGVEITHHADPAGVGSPDGEACPDDAVEGRGGGTEGVGQAEMAALGDEVKVEITKYQPERVGVLGLLRAMGPANGQDVGALGSGPQNRPSMGPCSR